MNDKYLMLIILLPLINISMCKEMLKFLNVDLTKKGFHRTIGYGLHFLEAPTDEICEYVLVQIFSQDVYVNAHELENLEKVANVVTYAPEFLEVEKTASNSYPFRLYIYGEVKGPTRIRFPIHFRYQPPNDQNFIKTHILAPKLYVACRSADIVRTPLTYDLPGFDISLLKPNNIWTRVEYSIQPMKLPVAHIPVGDKNFKKFVTIITITVSWLACLYILTAIMKKKSLDKKL